jgi:prepilin-type N-terminal cleavage/methylation domain-containing protein
MRRGWRAGVSAGFTLVELLVAVTILGIIMSTLTAALIAFLHNGETNNHRGDNAAKASILADYLDRDFASAAAMTTTASGQTCSSPVGAPPTLVFQLTWQDWTASTTNPTPSRDAIRWSAQYFEQAQPAATADDIHNATPFQIVRQLCKITGTTGTVTQNSVLVTDLVSATDLAVSQSAGSNPSACSPASPNAVVTLKAFGPDPQSVGLYTFNGCVGSRGQLS